MDAVIATHPHADHIGGMRKVIEAVPTDTVYMSNG
ncbi:MAG: MBL fold metallo-hydrolase, partial [Lachnospiraceae bacterium]|nr:MBL fold metallo-hydrolase [Lachnospiraceae bacterium]